MPRIRSNAGRIDVQPANPAFERLECRQHFTARIRFGPGFQVYQLRSAADREKRFHPRRGLPHQASVENSFVDRMLAQLGLFKQVSDNSASSA